jgi:hypothetical protein
MSWKTKGFCHMAAEGIDRDELKIHIWKSAHSIWKSKVAMTFSNCIMARFGPPLQNKIQMVPSFLSAKGYDLSLQQEK